MAQSLVESLAADFAPEQYEDDYKAAMQQLVEAKLEGEDAHELLAPDTTEADDDGDVVDLVAALRKSVETAQSRRGSASQETEPAADKPAKKAPTKMPSAKKSAAKKSTTKKAASKPTPVKKTA